MARRASKLALILALGVGVAARSLAVRAEEPGTAAPAGTRCVTEHAYCRALNACPVAADDAVAREALETDLCKACERSFDSCRGVRSRPSARRTAVGDTARGAAGQTSPERRDRTRGVARDAYRNPPPQPRRSATARTLSGAEPRSTRRSTPLRQDHRAGVGLRDERERTPALGVTAGPEQESERERVRDRGGRLGDRAHRRDASGLLDGPE